MTTRIAASFPACRVVLALLTAGLAVPLDAQILSVPERSARSGRPIYVSAEIGFLDSQGRVDGQSGTIWNLGQAIQWRAAASIGFGPGAIGVAGSHATLPITRTGGANGTLNGDVDQRMLLATFRTPETRGFHQIVEVSTGLAQWSNLRGTGTITPGEEDARNAWAILIGYGFGIPLGSAASVTIVQDLGTLVGSKEGLPSGASRIVRQYTTRLGLRLRPFGATR